MVSIFDRKSPSEIRYYFDLTINEIILVLHQVLHEVDAFPRKKFMNFTIEQVKEHYSIGDTRKFTVIVLISNRILTLSEIVGEIKKMPQPVKNRKR